MAESAPVDLSLYQPWAVTYVSDGRNLAGYFIVPDGEGPYPAVLFNHGSGGLMPGSWPGIVALRAMGYAVFAPVRRGHNSNPGINWEETITAPWGSAEMNQQLLSALTAECDDTLAALDWLRKRRQIDSERIALVGSSFGGVMVVLAAGCTNRFKAGISFAGPSMSWPDAPLLQEAMLAAVQQATMPLFLIQAQNDNSLMPTYTLGAELWRLGKPHEVRIYPAISPEDGGGHGIFGTGVDLWRVDVARFLASWLPAPV